MAGEAEVRKGQFQGMHPREVFRERFLAQFRDPASEPEQDTVDRLEAVAWKAYEEGRKAPRTRKARAGLRDPGYDLSVDAGSGSRLDRYVGYYEPDATSHRAPRPK